MTDCQRYQQFILTYIDDDLDILQRKDLEQHLEACDHCAHCLRQLQQLRVRLKSLKPVQTSETFQIVLRECIRRQGPGRRNVLRPSRPLVWRLVPVAGVALVLVLTSIYIIVQRSPSSRSGESPTVLTRVSSQAEQGDSQIQYILEDYPDRISVSRDDSERSASRAEYDSLLQRSRSDELYKRMTTVSF